MLLPFNIFDAQQAAILLGIAALLGACIGSFVNCLAWRLVAGESVLKGRSHCTSCGHTLGVPDLIPIVSWIALRGRCRHCGERVSPRYVIVEVALAVVFAALLVAYGISVQTLAYWALASILMAIALVDLDTYTIPNGFIVAALAVWLLLMVASFAGLAQWPIAADGTRVQAAILATDALVAGAPPAAAAVPFSVGSLFAPLVGGGALAAALDGLAGAFAVGGGILLFSLAFDALTKRPSLGGGDIKMLFAVGLFLGLAASLLNLLIACILGLILALVRPARHIPQADGSTAPCPPSVAACQADSSQSVQASGGAQANDAAAAGEGEPFRTRAIPFGPAIAAATILTLLVGPTILTWYLSLI